MDAEIKVGDKFNSFAAVESAVNKYAARRNTKYSRLNSRKIVSLRDKEKYEINPALIYYRLKYACIIRGAKKFLKPGKEIRKTNTVKNDCPVHIAFRATLDGKYLEVQSCENNHNHETSEVMYVHWPRLCETEEDLNEKMLDLQCNKKLLQQKLPEESGNIFTLQDLSNVSRKFNKMLEINLNDAVQMIKDKYSADVEVDVYHNRTFKGLFVQTPRMKQVMEAYTELLAIELLDINIPVFVFFVEDSNHQSEIIAIALLANEEKETIEWMLDVFQWKNPSWVKIKSIMAGKYITERGVLKVKFPDANHLICSFHVLRTFSKEVTTEKMGITQCQRNSCLEILQLMVHARNEEEFNTHLENLKSIAPQSVLDYYNNNWHGIEEDWHLGPNYHNSNFLNSINNRLESMNLKLKSVSSKSNTFLEFFEKLFKLLGTIENERNHTAVTTVLKKAATVYEPNSPEYLYFDLLTRDSATYVETELKEHKTVSPSFITEEKFVFETKEGNIDSTSDSCTCSFRKSMLLPCKHIFYVRSMINLNLFDKGLCSERWHREFSLRNQKDFLRNDNSGEAKSVAEKRRLVSGSAEMLIDTLSLCRTDIFEKRVKVLEDLILYWRNNKEVGLIELATNSSDFENDSNGEEAEENVDENDFAKLSSSVTDGSYITEAPQDYSELHFHVPDVPFYIETTEYIPTSPHVSDATCLNGIKMPNVVRKRDRSKGHCQSRHYKKILIKTE